MLLSRSHSAPQGADQQLYYQGPGKGYSSIAGSVGFGGDNPDVVRSAAVSHHGDYNGGFTAPGFAGPVIGGTFNTGN